MILLIENYDGCANNIYQLAGQLNPDIQIVRNDRIGVEEVQRMNPSHIILPGAAQRRKSRERNAHREGFFGQDPDYGYLSGLSDHLRSLRREVHPDGGNRAGKAGFDQSRAQDGPVSWSSGYVLCRILSFRNRFGKDIPQEFDVIARNGNDVAGIAHKTEPTFGLQFHPESFLSEYGKEIMQNFLLRSGNGA